MRDQQIQRIMTTDPASIAPTETTAAAQLLLESRGIHHLPVVDKGRLVGIVSTSDLLKLYLLDGGAESSGATTVDQIMERDPIVLESTSGLRDATEKLSSGDFHSLPVVDEDRQLVGIVTSTDLIDYLLLQLPRGDGTLAEVSVTSLQARNKVLEDVCHAAELYIRSGHAEQEHMRLLKSLEAARSAPQQVHL